MDKKQIEKLKFKWPLSTHSMCEGCSAPDDVGNLIAEIKRLLKVQEDTNSVVAEMGEINAKLYNENQHLTAIAEKAKMTIDNVLDFLTSQVDPFEVNVDEEIKLCKTFQQLLAAWEKEKK